MELTKHEKDILKLICNGESNKGIAQKLNVNENTIKLHISKLYEKYGISGKKNARIRLIVQAFRAKSLV